jgi:hypothetical protein
MQHQPTGSRRCTRCGEEKSLDQFYVRRDRGGVHPHCKSCHAASRRRNRAKYAQADRDRARYATDPEFRERRRRNEEARIEAGYPTNTRRYREIRQQFYAEANGRCAICGDPMTFDDATLDHIVPLSKGGPHTLSNLQIAHRVCNSVKGARLPDAA